MLRHVQEIQLAPLYKAYKQQSAHLNMLLKFDKGDVFLNSCEQNCSCNNCQQRYIRLPRISSNPIEPCGILGPQKPPDMRIGGAAYLYDISNIQIVPSGTNVSFDTNGVITPAEFVTHTPGTADIIIGQTGTYLIHYEISPSEVFTIFALFNGATMIPGSNYSSVTGDVTYSGQVIAKLNALDVLTLRNINVPATLGGNPTITVNASISILRVA